MSGALAWEGLTSEQRSAVQEWWNENDPDGTVFEYADNCRYAIQGNVAQEAAYDEIRRGGCCGFHDTEIAVGGVTLLFGFNYGH